MKKTLFLSILFLGITNLSFGQSKKIDKKAEKLVEKLNSEIIKGDKDLGLSDEQKITIKKIQIERLTALKNLGKSASKEDKKASNKTYNKKIYKEVLTKKQFKARKMGKAKKEEHKHDSHDGHSHPH